MELYIFSTLPSTSGFFAHTVEYSISTEKLEDNKVVLAYFIAKCAHMVVEYVPSAWICPCLVKQKAVDFVHTRQFDLNVSLT